MHVTVAILPFIVIITIIYYVSSRPHTAVAAGIVELRLLFDLVKEECEVTVQPVTHFFVMSVLKDVVFQETELELVLIVCFEWYDR